eukprot:gnl/Chilomastix_cuspidata/2917.p1 GENE.gnl/Chilomastix_cuspidata/2917~~gnl/Chilomastix_cuspidata/2917.p1  ORF type:complete len:1095 (-),score=385.77 gnl/Chilomastix_cuspidata/2917:360-3644(-)
MNYDTGSFFSSEYSHFDEKETSFETEINESYSCEVSSSLGEYVDKSKTLIHQLQSIRQRADLRIKEYEQAIAATSMEILDDELQYEEEVIENPAERLETLFATLEESLAVRSESLTQVLEPLFASTDPMFLEARELNTIRKKILIKPRPFAGAMSPTELGASLTDADAHLMLHATRDVVGGVDEVRDKFVDARSKMLQTRRDVKEMFGRLTSSRDTHRRVAQQLSERLDRMAATKPVAQPEAPAPRALLSSGMRQRPSGTPSSTVRVRSVAVSTPLAWVDTQLEARVQDLRKKARRAKDQLKAATARADGLDALLGEARASHSKTSLEIDVLREQLQREKTAYSGIIKVFRKGTKDEKHRFIHEQLFPVEPRAEAAGAPAGAHSAVLQVVRDIINEVREEVPCQARVKTTAAAIQTGAPLWPELLRPELPRGDHAYAAAGEVPAPAAQADAPSPCAPVFDKETQFSPPVAERRDVAADATRPVVGTTAAAVQTLVIQAMSRAVTPGDGRSCSVFFDEFSEPFKLSLGDVRGESAALPDISYFSIAEENSDALQPSNDSPPPPSLRAVPSAPSRASKAVLVKIEDPRPAPKPLRLVSVQTDPPQRPPRPVLRQKYVQCSPPQPAAPAAPAKRPQVSPRTLNRLHAPVAEALERLHQRSLAALVRNPLKGRRGGGLFHNAADSQCLCAAEDAPAVPRAALTEARRAIMDAKRRAAASPGADSKPLLDALDARLSALERIERVERCVKQLEARVASLARADVSGRGGGAKERTRRVVDLRLFEAKNMLKSAIKRAALLTEDIRKKDAKMRMLAAQISHREVQHRILFERARRERQMRMDHALGANDRAFQAALRLEDQHNRALARIALQRIGSTVRASSFFSLSGADGALLHGMPRVSPELRLANPDSPRRPGRPKRRRPPTPVAPAELARPARTPHLFKRTAVATPTPPDASARLSTAPKSSTLNMFERSACARPTTNSVRSFGRDMSVSFRKRAQHDTAPTVERIGRRVTGAAPARSSPHRSPKSPAVHNFNKIVRANSRPRKKVSSRRSSTSQVLLAPLLDDEPRDPSAPLYTVSTISILPDVLEDTILQGDLL